MKSVIIDGVEYIPKNEKRRNEEKGLTDEQLINRAAFASAEYFADRWPDGTLKDPHDPDHRSHPF